MDAVPGDYVLVHVGFALTKLRPDEADELMRMLREIAGTGEVDDVDSDQARSDEVAR